MVCHLNCSPHYKRGLPIVRQTVRQRLLTRGRNRNKLVKEAFYQLWKQLLEDTSMLMADTLAIFLSVLGMLLACPGLWLLCRGLWPQTVEQTAHDCRKTLWKPFLVGIPITALTVFVVALISKLPGSLGGISAVATFCLFIPYASTGVTGLATVIG